jgi:hypothetical protein
MAYNWRDVLGDSVHSVSCAPVGSIWKNDDRTYSRLGLEDKWADRVSAQACVP